MGTINNSLECQSFQSSCDNPILPYSLTFQTGNSSKFGENSCFTHTNNEVREKKDPS